MDILKTIGMVVFILCIIIMYCTNYGIPGIRKYDENFKLLDMRFHYSVEDIKDTLTKIGDEGRKAYFNYLILDFIFIFSFFIVQFVLTDKFVTNVNLKNILYVLVIARAVFDIIENSILLKIIHGYPSYNIELANICTWITTFKFVMMYTWIIGILGFLLHNLIYRKNV